MEKYSDEVLNMKFDVEVLDGTKPERTFFSITEDTLRDVYHVLPSDSLEEARKKIIEVVSTDEFLYDYFHKDPRSWEIKEFEPGYWTTPAKEDGFLSKDEIEELGYTEEEISKMKGPIRKTKVIQTYQQKLTIRFARRKPENAYSDASFFELYEKEMEEFLAHDSVYTAILKNKFIEKNPKLTKKEKYDSDRLLVIPDVELHLGKLASKFDSTDSYDYKKAFYRYIKIILEAEKVQRVEKAKTIAMTIGNDFFNTDTEQNTTTAGTEQHNDTRFQQMIANGIAAHIWAIERMKKNCDQLIIKFNPGNHDHLIDLTLFMQIAYLYRDDPKVRVDSTIKDSRWATCLVFGDNLIIFAHGKTSEGKALNDAKLSLLPVYMFEEEAKKAKNIYVHAGHLHSTSINNYSKRQNNKVTVMRVGSPSGDGAWDSGNLYSSDKSHQVYVYDANRGLRSTINIKLTKEELEKAISVPSITDDTDYLRTIEKSIDNTTIDVLADDIKKLNSKNEKQIRLIDKKYEKILKDMCDQLGVIEITVEQKKSLLNTLGYFDEIKPYVEMREELSNRLSNPNKKLSFKK